MSTDNTETLRAAIETALRRRDPRATVQRSPTESDRSLWIARWPRLEIMTRGDDGYFGLDALRALALACGLRDDGSDPAEEVEQLHAALARTADRLGCADYDDVAAAVSAALDESEALDREAVDESNALRMDRDALTRELAAARAALLAAVADLGERAADASDDVYPTWPLVQVLERLASAADHLLDVHDCDAHGHEGVRCAAKSARALVDALRAARDGR